MGWTEIQAAMVTWLRNSTGLASGHVVMAEQAGPRPAKPFAVVTLSGPIPIGIDGVKRSNTPGAPEGQEVTLTVRGEREIGASVQIFTDSVQGTAWAMPLAAKAQTGIRLPTVQGAIHAAGLSICEVGAARNLTEVFRTTQEGRAQFDVRFLTRHELAEYVGYIETLTITDTTAGRAIPVPAT